MQAWRDTLPLLSDPMYNLTSRCHEYHHEIVGFVPRTDIDMGRWGFGIHLSAKYAALLKSVSINKDRISNLHVQCHQALKAVLGGSYLDLFDRSYPHLQFWDNTCLLTNLSVPGNACGLYMEWNSFNNLGNHMPTHDCIEYYPHNVDSMEQAVGLLAVWTTWYDLSRYFERNV